MMRQKAYVTGIAGLLGSNLAFLLRHHFVVGGVDLYPVSIDGVEADVYDLLSDSSLEDRLKEFRPNAVIHCAALVNVDYCEQHPREAFRLNSDLTSRLSKMCEALGVKLVYVSTDAVFDGQKSGFYNEDDSPSPLNVYGLSKLNGEHSVLCNSRNTVLRTNIYGWNYRSQRSFGEWIYHSLSLGDTLKLFADVVFTPILVNELAAIIRTVISEDVCGLYHAAGSGAISKYEFGVQLKQVFGLQSGSIVEASVDQFGFPARRSKNMALDSARLSARLGFRPSSPLEGLAEFRRLLESGYVGQLRGER